MHPAPPPREGPAVEGERVPGVQALELRGGHQRDGAGPVRGAVHREVVHQHGRAVGGGLHVELQHHVPEGGGGPERLEGVLRGDLGAAPVREDGRPVPGHSCPRDRRRVHQVPAEGRSGRAREQVPGEGDARAEQRPETSGDVGACSALLGGHVGHGGPCDRGQRGRHGSAVTRTPGGSVFARHPTARRPGLHALSGRGPRRPVSMRPHPVTLHVFPDGNNVAGQRRLSTGARTGVVGTTSDRPMFLCMRSGGSAAGADPAPGNAQGDG